MGAGHRRVVRAGRIMTGRATGRSDTCHDVAVGAGLLSDKRIRIVARVRRVVMDVDGQRRGSGIAIGIGDGDRER